MIREDVVQRLVATGQWSDEDARLGERANYHCEYCDLDLLENIQNYKLWQKDHITPIGSGGSTDFENLALACKTCNWNWKNRWNPRNIEPEHTREKLIQAVRLYVAEQIRRAEEELEGFRMIVG
ncbi:MAG: HNH endonuclease signature motif containing protein [Candidatus Korobacteraceae bacterium]